MTYEYRYFKKELFDIEMTKARLTLVSLGKEIGCNRSKLSYLAHGWIPPKEFQTAIAIQLGVEPNDLWPKVPTVDFENEETKWGKYRREDEIILDDDEI